MRVLNRNSTITVLGQKIGNTYIRAEDGKSYPLALTKYTKHYPDYKKFWWVLKRYYFQWRLLKIIKYD